MSDESKITTSLVADDPLIINANYRMDQHDRRYIDNQILGVETHLQDSLLNGFHATWATLDPSSPAVSVGDCLCATGTTVSKALASFLATSGAVIGVATTVAAPNTKVNFIIKGSVPPSISGLGAGISEPVVVNQTTGRLVRTSSVLTSDFPVGTADQYGGVTLGTIGTTSGGGGGGGGATTTYNVDTSSSSISAGQWFVQANSTADPPTVALLTPSNVGQGIIGIATTSGSPGTTIQGATTGQVAKHSVTSLGSGTAEYVVINTTTARATRKAVPSFQDYIGGVTDTQGNISVLISNSRIGQSFCDPRDYGPCPGDGTTDSTTAILAALTDAQNTNRALRLPKGNHLISQPLRINTNGIFIDGDNNFGTTIHPKFQGPTFIFNVPWTDFPPVLANGPSGLNAFNVGQLDSFSHPRFYTINLRMCACAEVDALTSFSVEYQAQLTSNLGVSETAIIVASSGREISLGNNFNTAFLLGWTNTLSVTNGLFAQITVGHIKYQIHDPNPTTISSFHHVGIDWNGTVFRLLKDGNVVASINTPTGVTMNQEPWEGVFMGQAVGINLTTLDPVVNSRLILGQCRAQSVSTYFTGDNIGTTYTPPTGLFPNGNPNDLWVFNWDSIVQGDVNVGSFGGTGSPGSGRTIYAPVSGRDPSVVRVLQRCGVRKVGLNADAGAQAGGIYMQQVLHAEVEGYQSTSAWFALQLEGCFECVYRDIIHTGAAKYPGIINWTTSGDIIDNAFLANCSYGIVLNAGATITSPTIGQWAPGAAGIFCTEGFVDIHTPFFDSEAQNYFSRGCVLAGSCILSMRGGDVTSGNLIDQPVVSLDNSDGDFDFTSAVVLTGQSAIIDVVTSPPNQIKSRINVNGNSIPLIMSSTGQDFGMVELEQKTVGEPVVSLYQGIEGKREKRIGILLTPSNTPTTVPNVGTFLDPHSSYLLSVVISAKSSDGTYGHWTYLDVWNQANLNSGPTHGLNISSISGGSNSGSPPTGWTFSLVGDGSNTVNVQVTGATSTNITWVVSVDAQRVYSPPTWSPLELLPTAWFRGDVGSVSSWTDQSGNGNNAPAGTTAPTATTLGGQSAFNFAGGAWFQGSSTLLTSGNPFTILAVAQAADLVGGCIFADARGAGSQLAALVSTSGNITTVGAGGFSTVRATPQFAAEAKNSPFLFEITGYAVNSVLLGRCDLNRFNRTLSNFMLQATGTSGFLIGKNDNSQPWNGVIAELVIVSRPITWAERYSWTTYVNGRYSI